MVLKITGAVSKPVAGFVIFLQASFWANKDSYFTGRSNVPKTHVIFKICEAESAVLSLILY